MTTRIWLFVFGVTLGGLTSCKPTAGQPSLPRKVINCSGETVGQHWTTAYPPVMACLTALIESPMTCLDAVPVAVNVALEVVACIVRYSGTEAAASAGVNPTDVVSVRKAERAKAWIEYRRLGFQ